MTWGDPAYGGDSSQVQEQLRNVQHIQSTAGGAFASILESGSVVTWGDGASVGDSNEVQEQQSLNLRLLQYGWQCAALIAALKEGLLGVRVWCKDKDADHERLR